MATKRTITPWKGASGLFYWHATATNGKVTADSGQGYKTRSGARKAAEKEYEGRPNVVFNFE